VTPYFDVTQQTHKDLLSAESAGRSDLAQLAAECEADVLNLYTRKARSRQFGVSDPMLHPQNLYLMGASDALSGGAAVGPGAVQVGTTDRYVYLQGYTADAALADADLALALRRTIATVIDWRHYNRNRNRGLSAEGGSQKRSVTYRADANDDFPRGHGRWLKNFDLRERNWAL
jgi:hypothetical protein